MNINPNLSPEERTKVKIQKLENSERYEYFPPELLLSYIEINTSDVILDLGAGSGFLTIPVAKKTLGTVYGLDSDPNMLETVNSKAQELYINNINPIEGLFDNIPLSDESVDIVIASMALHEAEPLADTLNEIKRILKQNGKLFCFEFDKIEAKIGGPRMEQRVSLGEMKLHFKNSGYDIISEAHVKEFAYVLIGSK
jgi:ubiquinone/menaquinone biosynthesis C-methylase UbiE